jgi:hypothetical protein
VVNVLAVFHDRKQQTARSPLLVEDQAGGPCGESCDVRLAELGQNLDLLSSFGSQGGGVDLDRLRTMSSEPINSSFATFAKLVAKPQ